MDSTKDLLHFLMMSQMSLNAKGKSTIDDCFDESFLFSVSFLALGNYTAQEKDFLDNLDVSFTLLILVIIRINLSSF